MLKSFLSNKTLVLESLLIIIGIFLLIIKLSFDFKNKSQYNRKTENNISDYSSHNTVEKEGQSEDYIGYLKIPKINLEKGLVDKNSRLNYVDLNIQIIKESDMPDVDSSNLILAAHSGNSMVSYFKDLNKITYDDVVYIEYNNKLYTYKVSNYYTVEKTGGVDIVRNLSKTTLTLITCVENTNRQMVVICELIEINNL